MKQCEICGSERLVVMENPQIRKFFQGRKQINQYCEYCRTTTEIK